MKNINRQIVKLLTPIFLLALCCACFFNLNGKSEPVLAETISQVQTVDLTPDENGFLNLEKWEDYTPSSSTSPTAMGLTESSGVKVWGRILDGTVYKINTAEELAEMAKKVNGGTGNGCSFVLNADIDLSGKIWTPIGIENSNFKGKFYGNGHKISGVIIDNSISVDNNYKHLFGYVDTSAGIYDVIIETSYGCNKGWVDKDNNDTIDDDIKNVVDGCKIDGKDCYSSAIKNNVYKPEDSIGNFTLQGVYYGYEPEDAFGSFYSQLRQGSTSMINFSDKYSQNYTITNILIYELDWEKKNFCTSGDNNNPVATIPIDLGYQKTAYAGLRLSSFRFCDNREYSIAKNATTVNSNKTYFNLDLKSTHQSYIKIVVEFAYKIVEPEFTFYTIRGIKNESDNLYSVKDSNIYYSHGLSEAVSKGQLDFFDFTKEGISLTNSFRYNDELNPVLKNKLGDYNYYFQSGEKITDSTKIGNDSNIDIYIFNIEEVEVYNKITYNTNENCFCLGGNSSTMTAYRIFEIVDKTNSLTNKIIYSKDCGIINNNFSCDDFINIFKMLEVYYTINWTAAMLSRGMNSSYKNQTYQRSFSIIYANWCVKSVEITINGSLEGIKTYTYFKESFEQNSYVYAKELDSDRIETLSENQTRFTLFYTEKLYFVDGNSEINSEPLSYYLKLSGEKDEANNNPIKLARDFEYSDPSSKKVIQGDGAIEVPTQASNGSQYYAAAVLSILQNGATYKLEKCDKKIGSIKFMFKGISSTGAEMNLSLLNDYFEDLQAFYSYKKDQKDEKVSLTIWKDREVEASLYQGKDFTDYNNLESAYKFDLVGNTNNTFTLKWKSTSRVGMTFDKTRNSVSISKDGIEQSVYKDGILDYTSLNFKITNFNKNNEDVIITITLKKTENTFVVNVKDSDGNSDFNNTKYKDASKITINGEETNSKKVSQGTSFDITYNSGWFSVESINCSVSYTDENKDGGIDNKTLDVSQIALDNGSGTITIDPRKLGAYYGDVDVTVTLTKVEKTVTLEVVNGTIDNSGDPKTISYYYNTSFYLKAEGDDKYTLTITNNNVSTTYTIKPNSHYGTGYVSGMKGGSSVYGCNLDTNASITVTYSPKEYNVNWDLGYYDDSGVWKNNNKNLEGKITTLAETFNGTLKKPSNTQVEYFNFLRYEIVKDGKEPITITKDDINENLIDGYKFKINDTDISNYLNYGIFITSIKIRMVYEPILYKFEFSGYNGDVATTSTKQTSSAAEDSFEDTLLKLLGDDLQKTGYEISGFHLSTDEDEAYGKETNVKDVITEKHTEQTINLTVEYKGKPVKLAFVVTSLGADREWSTTHTLNLTILEAYGTPIPFGKQLQNAVEDYESGIYKISAYSYENIDWERWQALTETDDDVLFNNFSEGKTDYTVYVRLEKVTKTITFDETYCSETSIEYDSINKTITGTIPTPTRDGFEFLGWGYDEKNVMIKKADSTWESSTSFDDITNNTDWKIYYSSNSDEVTLYAYWKFVGTANNVTISDNEFVYNGTGNNVTIYLPNWPGVGFAFGSVSKNGGGDSDFIGNSIKNGTLTLSGFKYVAHGGTYKVTLNSSLTTETGAVSSAYITNPDAIGALSIDVTVTITKAELTRNGSADKVYDGTTSVKFTISGVAPGDSISASYADKNVGEQNINYTFDDNDIKDSYNIEGLPTKGKIETLKVTVKVIGSVKSALTNINLANIEWKTGTSSWWNVSGNDHNLTFEYDYNDSNVWNAIKGNLTIKFTIKYNGSVVVSNFECSENNNVEVIIDSTEFRVATLTAGEKGYVFVAYLDTDTDKETPIALVFDSASPKESEGKYEIIIESDENTLDTFKFNFGTSYTNYWIKKITVGGKELSDIPKADTNNNFTLTILGTAEEWTNVEIILTQTSNITFNLLLAENETIEGASVTDKQIAYGTGYTLPSGLTRTGFTFDGWSSSKNNVSKVTSSTWQIKETNVTLYAVWIFTSPTLTLTGDISKTYDGEESEIGLTVSGNNDKLTYEFSLQKQNGESWVNVDGFENNILKVKNVADSGTYKAVLTKVYAKVDDKIVTYYNDSSTMSGSKTVTINKKDVEFNLTEISKVFDGFATYIYTISDTDFADDINNELSNKTITFKFKDGEDDSINVGTYGYNATTGKKLNFESLNDTVFNNYNISFKNNLVAEITKRQIKLDVGEDKTEGYTGGVWAITIEQNGVYDLSVDPTGLTNFDDTNVNFKFSSIQVKTNKPYVGVYPSVNEGLELVPSVTIVDKINNNINIQNTNFEFTIVGKFEITKANLTNKNVKINDKTVVTYNGNSQTIHVEITNLTSKKPFSYTLLGKDGTAVSAESIPYNTDAGKFLADISTGKKDVGEYEFTLTLKSDDYNDYTSAPFYLNITTLYVTGKNGSVTYSRKYDATKNVNFSENNVSFTTSAGATVDSALVGEILNNYTFEFSDKNVGTDKTISFKRNNNSYKNIEIAAGSTFTGKIEQAEIYLNAGTIEKVYDSDGKYEIEYGSLTKYASTSTESTIVESFGSGSIVVNYSGISDQEIDLSGISSDSYSCDTLIMSDGKSVSTNYSVKGILGKLNINKAIIKITLGETYEYTAENAALNISAQLQKNNGFETVATNTLNNYVSYVVYCGQGGNKADSQTSVYKNAGLYTATFTINDSNCYTFEDGTQTCDIEFEITPKNVTISVKNNKIEHVYNGLNYVIKTEDLDLGGLINNHTINNIIKTSNSLHGVYNLGNPEQVLVLDKNGSTISGDTNAEKIRIYESGEDVSGNYNVTLSGAIEIVTTTEATLEYVGDDSLTYNGEQQEIKLKVTINGSTIGFFKVESGVTVKQYSDESFTSEINSGNTHISNVSAFVTLNNNESIGFKYAGEYTISLRCDSFTTKDITKEILPKTIGIDNLSYTAEKVYNGTDTVSVSISSEDFIENDSNCFNVSAKYNDKNVGENKTITFTFTEKTTTDPFSSYIFNSYTTNAVDDADNMILISNNGKITARGVTFTYKYNDSTEPTPYYYTGKALTLDVSRFDISNSVPGESFGGTITYNDIVNADEYALANSTDVETSSLTVSGDSSLNNYTITFAGNVTVNKAEVVVESVSGNSYTYDAAAHKATLTATISDRKGAIAEGAGANSIIIAKYGSAKSSEVSEAGTYSIYPEIASDYANNYTYAGGESLGTNLIIATRSITIKVEKSTYVGKLNNNENFEHTLSSSDVLSSDVETGLVAGHTIKGKVATNESATGTYKFSGTLEEFESSARVTLSDFGIYEIQNESTTVGSNYSVYFDITLNITEQVSDGELFIKSKNNLTYDGTEKQFENVFDVTNNTNLELDYTVYYYNDFDAAKDDLGKLKDDDINASGLSGSTALIKDAGTYYAIVLYKPKATEQDPTIYSNVVTVVINKKQISSFKFSDGTTFGLTKTYDAKSEVTGLTTDDIVEADKNKFSSITATFSQSNVGENLNITFAFVADGSLETHDLLSLNNNYSLASQTGSITKKEITVALNSSKSYTYAGEKTHTIEASALTATGLVGSDELAGNVTIAVNGVGPYGSNCITANALKVMSNGTESKNYTITISSTFSVSVTELTVTLTKNNATITYLATDLKDKIVDEIISFANSALGEEIKTQLKNNFYSIFTVKIDETETNEIKDAKTYSLTIKTAKSGNFEFKFETDTTSMQIQVEKADLNINFANSIVTYSQYLENSGYVLTANQVSGLLGDDQSNFSQIKITTDNGIVLGEKYEYPSTLSCSIGNLSDNYNASSIAGDLTLTSATEFELTFENPTYKGKNVDLFDEIKVFKGTEECTTEKVNESDTITFVVDSDGNTIDYTIKVVVDKVGETKIYQEITVNVQPKKVKEISFKSDKTYDGTNVVYDEDGNSNLSSTEFVTGDNVYAKGTYESYMAMPWGITFTPEGDHAGNYKLELNTPPRGNITKKGVIIDVGEDLEFTYSLTNIYSHTLTSGEIIGLVSGDELEEGTVVFALERAAQNQDIAECTTANLTIKCGEADVSDCYEFTFEGKVTINARKFKIDFGEDSTPKGFNNAQQEVVWKVINDDELSDDDKAEIEKSITIIYAGVEPTVLNGTTAPKDVGTYKATISCLNANYSLTDGSTRQFEITKHIYTITEVQSFERTEFDTTALTQDYNVDFGENGTIIIQVTFENVDNGTDKEKELGLHNIKLLSCNNPNIKVEVSGELLEGKLKIIPDSTKTLTITLNSFAEGVSNDRQYGMKDIDKFDLSNFVYTCTVETKTLTNEEINLINLTGNIFFEKGNVGEYGYSSHNLESEYGTIAVETALKLKITKRTIEITANYDKVFDGTTDFVNEINYQAVTNGDEFVENLPNVSLKYESANAGEQDIIVECSDTTNFNVALKDNAGKKGTISKLEVTIGLKAAAAEFVYGDLVVTTLDDEKFVDMFDNCEISYDNSSKITSEKLKELISAKIECENANVSTSNKLKVGDEYTVTYTANESIILTSNSETVTVTTKEVKLVIVDSLNNKKEISKEQDGTTNVVLAEGESLVLDGIVDGDVVTITKAEYATATYGDSIEISVSTTGADVGNYSIVASGKIIKKEIKIKYNYNLNGVKGDILIGTLEGTYCYYEKIEAPTPSHKENGYTFKGWGKSAESTATNKLDFVNKPLNEIFTDYSTEITIYAIWEINKFTVTFKTYTYDLSSGKHQKDESATYQSQTHDYGTELSIENIAEAIDHYTYSGYCLTEQDATNYTNIDSNKHVVKKDITIYLVYSLNKYSVKFESDVEFKNINVNSHAFAYSNSNKTLTITDFYGKKLGDIAAELSSYLTLEKTGYTFNGYSIGETTYTIDNLLNITIPGDETTYTAKWTANTYTLTLKANGGTFCLEDGWSYVDGDHGIITKDVKFDSNVLLPTPTRAGYEFGGYTYNENDIELTDFVFNYDDNVEFTAKWNEKEFTLTIQTENVEKVTAKYYTANGTYLKEETKQVQNNLCEFTVSTSNRVQIVPTGNLGYEFEKFVIGDQEETSNTYKNQSDFIENVTWEIKYKAKNNAITIQVNNTVYGYVESGVVSTDKNKSSITIYKFTGETLELKPTANEGYSIKEIKVISGENIDLVKVEKNNDETYTVSGFVSNITIEVVFEPKDVSITFDFDTNAISVLCDSKNISANFTKTTKVGETITFNLTVKYGYKLKNVTFTPTGSTNTGSILCEGSTYTFTGFTSDGTISIATEKETYTATFELAEFDETNETIIEITNYTNYVSNFENEITKEYKEKIEFVPTFATGWKVKTWQIKEEENYIDKSKELTYSFEIEKATTIRLVIERETYTITYNTSIGGSIKNSSGVQMESFSETVRFGRQAKGATATAWNDAEFDGWFEENTKIISENDINVTINDENASDHTYVAKFNCKEITIQLNVFTNTSRNDLKITNLSEFVKLNDSFVVCSQQTLNGRQVVVLETTVTAYSDINLKFNLPDWFEIDSTKNDIASDGTIVLNQVKTNIQDQTGKNIGYYEVSLKVKTFTVSITTENNAYSNQVSVSIKNGSQYLLKANKNEIVVEYGAKLIFELICNKGYMVTGITNVNYENNIATIESVTSNIECVANVGISKFKVSFNFNYKDGKPFPDIKNYVYYIYYGETNFFDSDNNNVVVSDSIADPQKQINDPYEFLYWNNSYLGVGSYKYSFEKDENGNIIVKTIVAGKETNGFVYDVTNHTNSDCIEVTLYAIWNYEKYSVSVEFKPGVYGGEITSIFGSSTKKFVYNNQVLYAVGSLVTINAPSIAGYKYYGWSEKNESNIKTENLSFTMGKGNTTVVLYYSFEISVGIKEPIENMGSTATVNGKSVANVIVGESFVISAIPAKGLVFDYWTVDGIKDSTLKQTETIVLEETNGAPHTYVAVFKIKNVAVEVENTEIATIKTNKTNFGLGETLFVYVDSIVEGYKITDITINGLGGYFSLSADGSYYYHIITIDDVETGLLVVKPLTATKTYNIKIESNLTGAGTISVNGQNLETFEANYNFMLNFETTESARYALKQVLFNGIVIKTKQDSDLLNFVVYLNANNQFNLDDGSVNTISFEFEKFFWIDTVDTMNGEGTENNPFLIANEKQLAYMAKMLNSGEIDQTNTHLYFMLTADLNLERAFWIPIGTQQHPFNGTFILNEHTINGVILDPDQTYTELAWETRLYGVFGYITENAELIYKVSKMPIIVLISCCALFVAAMVVVIVVIVVRKKNKIQKLSKKISTETLTRTSELNEQELNEFNSEQIITQDKNIPKKPKK